ncbi:MAG TPA: hypothetical protein VG672_26890 [Bryobacteraceae bacterium]|nr:hypothetical protein [Bryobacteraceae bacterium]
MFPDVGEEVACIHCGQRTWRHKDAELDRLVAAMERQAAKEALKAPQPMG